MQADIQDQLPLTEATFFILLSLAPKSRHGYAIMKEVGALSDGRVKLSTSTLYGALKRLLGQHWIERVNDSEDNENGRIRKAYTLTNLGRRILNAEVERLQALVTAAKLRPVGEQA